MFAIEFSGEAKKQLQKLPKKDLKRIFSKIEKLATDPKPAGYKALKGSLTSYYRIRSGDYRVVYSIENERLVILVVKVAHRKDVYDL